MDTFGLEKLGFRDVSVKLVHSDAFLMVSLKFRQPINVEHVCENLDGADYELSEYTRGGNRRATIKTSYGTIMLGCNGAQLLHVKDPDAISWLGNYLNRICNGEKRDFREWVRRDWEKFVVDELEWPKFLEEIGVRKRKCVTQ